MAQQTVRAEKIDESIPLNTIGQQVRDDAQRIARLEDAVRRLINHVHDIERLPAEDYEGMLTDMNAPRRGTLPPEASQ